MPGQLSTVHAKSPALLTHKVLDDKLEQYLYCIDHAAVNLVDILYTPPKTATNDGDGDGKPDHAKDTRENA